METPDRLETPLLLLAMPQVLDPFFHKSVVLLVSFEAGEGSLGFIVNRPTELKVDEILTDLELTWGGDDESRAYFGGPVNPEIGSVIYLDDTEIDAEDNDESDSREISPGVAFSQSLGDLEALAERPPDSFRLILGYAGWGDGQLEEEILRNDWIIAPVRNDLIFGVDTDGMWRSAVQSVGIEPDQLPAWTQGTPPDSSAN